MSESEIGGSEERLAVGIVDEENVAVKKQKKEDDDENSSLGDWNLKIYGDEMSSPMTGADNLKPDTADKIFQLLVAKYDLDEKDHTDVSKTKAFSSKS